MSDSRYSASQVLTAALVTTLVALAPLTSQAQSNAPLTGGMTSSPPAAAPAQALPQAQLPTRPVVQQVQTPMPQPQPATASTQVVQPASAAAPAEEAFGDVTRGLLAAQADGRRAGNMLPVLGPVSTAAWNRYLESFSHPIPEYLQKRVETKNTN